jgi:hypothetical protein
MFVKKEHRVSLNITILTYETKQEQWWDWHDISENFQNSCSSEM